ncbi:hypothetical protein MSG28_014728, partial [Choristoneura fumiferana]
MMDFDEIVVKESPGLCRCCLSEGCYKDLGSEYSWMSETEIYADMLLECFDISISQHPSGPNGSNRLICEVCITRLRDACNFKKQVLESEKRFVDMVGRGEFRPKEDLLKNEDYGEPSVSEDITVSALAVKGKRGRPKKSSTAVKPEKKAKVPKLEEKPTKSKAVAKDCRLCNADFNDINSLIGHLRSAHDKKFTELNGCFGVLPYRFDGDTYSFKCAVCNEEFKYFTKLNEHMNIHYGDYMCAVCGKGFLSQSRLRSHAQNHGSGFRCSLCPETFDSLTIKYKHESKVHNKKKVCKCFYCDETFPDYIRRKTHHRTVHNINVPCSNCPICHKAFELPSKMLTHLKEVHIREKNYSCTICDQKFFSKTKVQKHMVKHFGERVHQCEVCKKSYARKQTLRDHMRIHNNDKRFVCALCNVKPRKYKGCESSSMRRRRNLQILFNSTTIIPFKWRGKYLCFYCSKDIAEYSALRKHTKSHGDCSTRDHSLKVLKGGQNMEIKIDVSDISCEICSEPFPTYDDIVTHLFIKHKLEYDKGVDMAIEEYRLVDLSCLACEEKFAYFGYLVSHVNNSHPKNCLICDKCEQKFNKKRDLFSHMKNYHREGGYRCESCPQSFSSLNILRKHRNNRHLTRCTICQLKLPSAALKQKHMEVEHPDDGSLQCDNCFKEFHTKQGLRMHARKCKGDELFQIEIRKKDYDPMDLDQNYEDPVKRPSVKQIRENIVIVINMSTAIPFNFYKNKFNCFYCSKDFPDSDLMREHTIIEHPICDVKQKCIRKCRESVACVKIDISSLACKLCFESVSDFDTLLDHLILKHDANYDKSITTCLQPYRLIKDHMACPHCPNEVFRFFGTLLKHMNNIHTNNNIICVYCGQTFRRDQNLRVHIWRHHRDGRFKCNICGADCNIPSRLYMHMAKAHGVKAAKCPKCPESFSTQYLRQKHLIEVHNSGHKCSYCGKLFTRNSFMRDHIRRTHLKEKNVECSICNMKFFNNILLRRHMVKHSGEKNFHCDICGERFFWRKSLQIKHQSIGGLGATERRRKNLVILFNNTTVIPFKSGSQFGCFYCGEKYRDYKEFVKHTKSHGPCNVKHKSLVTQKYGSSIEVKLDISNVTCELCDEPFNSLDEIIPHLIAKHGLHYDQDVPMCLSSYRLVDLKCTECGKSFEYFRNLVMHVRKNHMEKLVPCEQCDKSFNKKSDLAAHCRIYHRRAGFQCVKCELCFRKNSLLRLHLMNTHGASESKCARILSRLKSRRNSYLRLDAEDLAAFEDIDDCEIETQRRRLRERNAIAKRNRENIACILNMTTAIPFKYYQNRFTCFHCSKDFNEHEDVRTHTLLEHPFYDLERKCPKSLKGVNVCLKLDITSLSCRICFEPFNDFDLLVDHLILNHKANYDKNLRDDIPHKKACELAAGRRKNLQTLFRNSRVIPFQWRGHYACIYCSTSCLTYDDLVKHINSHDKSLIEKYLAERRLKTTLKLDVSDMSCQLCDDRFKTLDALIDHLVTKHDLKYDRQVQMLIEQYKLLDLSCPLCEENFSEMAFLNFHVNSRHADNFQCEYCSEMFQKKKDLKLHNKLFHTDPYDDQIEICVKEEP